MRTMTRWTVALAEIRKAELVEGVGGGRGWPDSRVAGAAGKRYAGDLMRRMMQAAYRLWS